MDLKYDAMDFMDQDSFYICMNCCKIYQENPQVCRGSDGEVHSEFVDMAKFRGGHPQVRSYSTHESSLRFDVGQVDNLEFVIGMRNLAFERILNGMGFETLGIVDNSRERKRSGRKELEASRERVKQNALALASSLNERGERYFVFSNSFVGYYLCYTFMRKSHENRSSLAEKLRKS